MKCIGVNQWAGVDPVMAETLSEIGQWAASASRAEKERFSRLTPSEKFLRLAHDRFQKPRLFGIDLPPLMEPVSINRVSLPMDRPCPLAEA
jgi:hypothetical protein